MDKIVLICHDGLAVKASPNTVVSKNPAKEQGRGALPDMDLDIMEPGATKTIKLSELRAKMEGK